MTQHLDDRVSVARKPHLCNLCERPIDAGERHQVTFRAFLARATP